MPGPCAVLISTLRQESRVNQSGNDGYVRRLHIQREGSVSAKRQPGILEWYIARVDGVVAPFTGQPDSETLCIYAHRLGPRDVATGEGD